VDCEEWADSHGVEIMWRDTLPPRNRGYYRPERHRLYLNRPYWQRRPRRELESFILHEVGHELTATAYYPGSEPAGSTRLRVEAKATRAGIGNYIPDEAVLAAIADDCTEVWQFAAAWEVDEATAAARLKLWQRT
jgi:hypothetical protein